MKTPVLQTLKGASYLIFSIVFILLFAVNSCKKDDSNLRPLEPLIVEAKNYFDTQIATQPEKPIDDNPRHQVAKKPLWEKAYTKTISIGQAVIVPLEYSSNVAVLVGKNKDKAFLKDISYLMLYKNQEGVFHAEVVTHIPDVAYWVKGKATGKDFSGIVMVEDWWGKTIKIFRKEANGAITYLNKSSVKSPRNSGLAPLPGEMLAVADEPCEITVWTNERGMYEVELICNRNTTEGGQKPDEMPSRDHELAGGGGEDGLPSRDYGEEMPPNDGGGSGSGDNNPPPANEHAQVKEIENELQNTCLKNTLDNLLRNNFKNKIGFILHDIFQETKTLDLNFSESYDFPDNVYGSFDEESTIENNGHIVLFVRLNGKILPNASIEFSTVTMLHETLHAYFEVQNKLHKLDHEEMAHSYREAITEILSQLYPNSMNSIEANALAWQGLMSTSVWYNFKNTNLSTANEIVAINSKFRRGEEGLNCNME